MPEEELLSFESRPWVRPKRLDRSRVALVTTAGLRIDSHEVWRSGDFGFTVIPREAEGVTMLHLSNNFDRTGFLADLNVVYPIDRLVELEQRGIVGSAAANHLSFMGGQIDATLDSLRVDTGPAAAKVLKEDGVDLILLTPVCPSCTRIVGTLSHIFEQEGIATVGISSIRGVTEELAPPRALYCEFPLGRPLGKPDDPEFQHRVLGAAFALLEAPSGPVIADFPETIEQDLDQPVACNLPPEDTSGLHPAIAEAKALKVAHNRAFAGSGVTNVGRVVEPALVPDLVGKFVILAEGGSLEDSGLGVDDLLPASSDIRAYYEEAALALSDHVPAAGQSDKWIYDESAVGMVLRDAWGNLSEMGLPVRKWLFIVPARFHDTDQVPDSYR
ncbi:MAG: hypothetical protein ACRDPE_19205 [Solirubrobacterales bacterium]